MPGPITRSRQDYLKALFALSSDNQSVATSRLAARLDVTAPSVTKMLARLAREQLVTYAPHSGARLSAKGRRFALEIVRRHRILETFLVRVLGLDWADVHEDAEILEHHISDRVLDAIDRHMQHPKEDPHGHLIPDRTGRVRKRMLRPLASLHAGEKGIVREIKDGNRARMLRWSSMGLVPGAKVVIRDVRADDDVFELDVQGSRLVTGRKGLEGVWVERSLRPERPDDSAV